MTRYTLDECQAKLPVIAVLMDEYLSLEKDFDALWDHDCCSSKEQAGELNEEMGIVLEDLWKLGARIMNEPVSTVHFEGYCHGESVIFCWEAGEDTISHGHWPGEVCDSRRKLHPKFGWPLGDMLNG